MALSNQVLRSAARHALVVQKNCNGAVARSPPTGVRGRPSFFCQGNPSNLAPAVEELEKARFYPVGQEQTEASLSIEAKVACSVATTCAPSPTAAATRLIEPERTSPIAKIPRRLVSSGLRVSLQSPPVSTKPFASNATPDPDNQSVAVSGGASIS